MTVFTEFGCGLCETEEVTTKIMGQNSSKGGCCCNCCKNCRGTDDVTLTVTGEQVGCLHNGSGRWESLWVKEFEFSGKLKPAHTNLCER